MSPDELEIFISSGVTARTDAPPPAFMKSSGFMRSAGEAAVLFSKEDAGIDPARFMGRGGKPRVINIPGGKFGSGGVEGTGDAFTGDTPMPEPAGTLCCRWGICRCCELF
jgi:hypothetical protein